MKFTYIMGTFSTKLRSYFRKVSITINEFFPLLEEILYAGCVKLFTPPSKGLKITVFQLGDAQKIASSECTLQEAKKFEVEGAKLGL